MSRDDLYRQCLLVEEARTDVAWVPAHLARENGVVRVKADGTRWVVRRVYEGVKRRDALDTERAAQKKYEGDLEPHR